LTAPLLEQVRVAEPQDLQIARPDGTIVAGWLMSPATTSDRRLPLILSVHGGPHNYFGDVFSFDHQLFAARGFAVLYANPRGSGGGREEFARAVLEDWGGEDYLDLMAMLDHAIERPEPPIDPARLGIFGHSYGGYMTCWAVTQTDRFAAAVSGACISNLISFFGTSDIGASWGEREFGGTPFERRDWYEARSPVYQAERVKTPLLLYHGEADLRCPIEQSEQMFTALHRLGETVELVRVPQEPHGVLGGSAAHRVDVRRAILEWFERYL
jgi:dipeptidyl aminopeptidase/acylaminoacyl peptidase